MFSELPDNDANTQVLLLGVTRLDTPPRSSPPKFVKPKRPHTYHATTTTASDEDYYQNKTTVAAVDDTDDALNKSAANRKFYSGIYLADQSSIAQKDWINRSASKPTTFLSSKSKRNLNTFLGRFQNRNSAEKDIEDGATARLINCPLVVEPPCQNVEKHSANVNRDDQQQSTLSSFRVKKSKTARLTSCIPYCANRHESSEAPTDSIASSFRITECCAPIASSNNTNSIYRREANQRQHLIAQLNRLRTSNELISSNLSRLPNKSGQQQQNGSAAATTNNNNTNLFNNLNIMDRSVDSIGSCSLDVDAESTDFSGSTQTTNSNMHKAHKYRIWSTAQSSRCLSALRLCVFVCVWPLTFLPKLNIFVFYFSFSVFIPCV